MQMRQEFFQVTPSGLEVINASLCNGMGGWESPEQFVAKRGQRLRDAGWKPGEFRRYGNGLELHTRFAGMDTVQRITFVPRA